MKNNLLYIWILVLVVGYSSCEDFLDKPPLQSTSENFVNDPENAILAVNAIYDWVGMSEGSSPDYVWMSHHWEFMFGDMCSDDAEKGSEAGDFISLRMMENWNLTPNEGLVTSFWLKGYVGIARCNYVLDNVPNATIEESLKSRIMGEAYFLRGWYYWYLLRFFGGTPIFTKSVVPSDFGNTPKASIHEMFLQINSDFEEGIKRLPKRSEYPLTEMGRVTKGAAQAFAARVMMYQIGVDAEVTKTWDDVYALTKDLIQSGEYSLAPNFAVIYEREGENNSESIWELQMLEGSVENNSEKVGENFTTFQMKRKDLGWGFNNPTSDLFAAFDFENTNDPRLTCTVYGETFNDGILYGKKLSYDRNQQGTNYLNRKATLPEVPKLSKSSDFNIRMIRYADVLLMHAEAAFHTNKEGEARQYVNMIRNRARNSTYCKGYVEGQGDKYALPGGVNLPDITASGNALLDAIWKERRLELAMEGLRSWDLIRQKRYIEVVNKVKYIDRKPENNPMDPKEELFPEFKANCESHSIIGRDGNLIPVLPIPLTEVQAWGVEQNKNY